MSSFRWIFYVYELYNCRRWIIWRKKWSAFSVKIFVPTRYSWRDCTRNLLQLVKTHSSNEMGKSICICIMSLEKHVRCWWRFWRWKFAQNQNMHWSRYRKHTPELFSWSPNVNNVFCFTHVNTSASREGTQWQIKKCSFRALYENMKMRHVLRMLYRFFYCFLQVEARSFSWLDCNGPCPPSTDSHTSRNLIFIELGALLLAW